MCIPGQTPRSQRSRSLCGSGGDHGSSRALTCRVGITNALKISKEITRRIKCPKRLAAVEQNNTTKTNAPGVNRDLSSSRDLRVAGNFRIGLAVFFDLPWPGARDRPGSLFRHETLPARAREPACAGFSASDISQ